MHPGDDLLRKVKQLEQLGWAPKVERDRLTGVWSIGLHRHFKNGKLRKTHSVALQHWPRNGRKEPSARPYRVESPRFSRAKAFESVEGS